MVLIHGDNQALSREYLGLLVQKAKVKNQEIVRLDGYSASITDVIQAQDSQSMFSDAKLVIIENLLRRANSAEKGAILKILDKGIILWEGKKINQATIAKLGNVQVKLFKIPAIIFKFLDSLWPGNEKNLISLLNQVTGQEPVELVFYLLSRRISQLIIAKDLGKNGLSAMPDWQQGKLLHQAQKFSLIKLKNIYKRLLELDTRQKTGGSLLDLAGQLSIMILDDY